MKYIRKINEYAATAPAPVKTPVKTPTRPTKKPWSPTRPPRRDDEELPGPKNTINSILSKIIKRYNSLVSGKSNEGLEDNLGIPKEYLDRIKASLPGEDIQSAMEDTKEVLELLAAIRESEKEYSDDEKKEAALNIVNDILSGQGMDVEDLDFELTILDDGDLQDAKEGTIVGKSPDEFKEIKKNIKERDPKMAKEMDIRSIQNALSQGFSSAVKDDFIMGDSEIQGVSFEDYYKFMSKSFGLYSKIPSELVHELLTKSPAIGRVKIRWDQNKDKYIIEASGYTILVLVHEMIKGVYELMSLHRQSGLDKEKQKELLGHTETQYMEREGLKYGPGLVTTFKEFFDKVEENLISDGVIEYKNPSMLAAILSKFYQLEDDLFLRVCQGIWNADDSDDVRPFDLFEMYYMEILDGDGDDDDYDDYTSPPTRGPGPSDDVQDDVLKDLLSGSGISLNLGPMEENLKYVLPFHTYKILEGYKDQLLKWSDDDGEDHMNIATYLFWFQQLTRRKPDKELEKAMTADIRGVDISNDWNNRKNIEQYKSFDELKAVVDAGRKVSPLPLVQTLATGDIGPAIAQIQKALELPQTGYYDGKTEDAIREFQKKFSEDVGEDMLKSFLQDSHYLKSSLEDNLNSEKKKLDKALSDEKISIEIKIKDIQEKIKMVTDSIRDLKSSLSGGLSKPSGKMDVATISAFMADKGITKLEGIRGDIGTFKPSGGKVILQTPNYRIWQILSEKFCIEARKGFGKTLMELGANKTIYNWCVAWDERSHYSNYRTSSHNQTIYFIENIGRSAAENNRWREFAADPQTSNIDNLGSTAGGKDSIDKEYLRWAGADQPILEDKARRFYDNYHVAVVFVNNRENEDGGDTSYWMTSASNDGEWGRPENGYPNFPFKKIADVMWPSNAVESIRSPIKDDVTTGAVQVPEKVISSNYYYVPGEKELKEIEKVMAPLPLSKVEKEERSGSSNRSVGPQEFEDMPYEEKEGYLQRDFWANHNNLMNDRNNNRISLEFWKTMPDKLKAKHLANSWTGLNDQMFMEIIDNPKLIEQHKEFIRRRLYGEAGRGGLIEHITKKTDSANNHMTLLRDLEKNILQPNEFNNLPKYDIEKKIAELGIELGKSNIKEKQKKSILNTKKSYEERLKNYHNLDVKYLSALKDGLKKIISMDPDMKKNADYNKLKKQYTFNVLGRNAKYGDPAIDKLFNKPEFNKLATDSTKVPVIKKMLVGNNPRDMKSKKIHPTVNTFLIRLVLNDVSRDPSIDKFKSIYDYVIKLDSIPEANYLFRIANEYYDFDNFAKAQSRDNVEKLYRLFDNVIDTYDKKYNGAFNKIGNDKKLAAMQRVTKTYTKGGKHTEQLG